MMRQLELDCRGMQCPAPILKVATAAREVAANPALLHVFANDSDFRADLEAWCRAARAQVRWENTGDASTFHAVVALNGASESAPTPTTANELAAPSRQAQPAAPTPPPRRAAPPVLDLTGVPAHVAVIQLTGAALDAPAVHVRSDDPQFQSALYAWASATRAEITVDTTGAPGFLARVRLPTDAKAVAARPPAPVARQEPQPLVASPRRATLLVLHNDLECLLGALLSANAFASQGMEVVMYFSFWGVNVLRGRNLAAPRGRRAFLQRVMQWMMPKGPERQRLGKMHMAGLGTGMMQHFMRRNNVLSLEELLEQAVAQEVRFIVCTMSMGVMGIRKADLMDLPNMEFAGVSSFAEAASTSSVSLTF